MGAADTTAQEPEKAWRKPLGVFPQGWGTVSQANIIFPSWGHEDRPKTLLNGNLPDIWWQAFCLSSVLYPNISEFCCCSSLDMV